MQICSWKVFDLCGFERGSSGFQIEQRNACNSQTEIKQEWFEMTAYQISAKWGPDSRFVVKANTRSRQPKSSRGCIVKLMDQGQVTRPRVEYRVQYWVEYWVKFWILGQLKGTDRGIRLWLESNNSGSFLIGSYTNNSWIGDYFLNSKAGSSYSSNLAAYNSKTEIKQDKFEMTACNSKTEIK